VEIISTVQLIRDQNSGVKLRGCFEGFVLRGQVTRLKLTSSHILGFVPARRTNFDCVIVEEVKRVILE
jgi:hypothetical protein